MNLFMLLSASDTSLSNAALYALVGFLIVLSVLAILVGIFYLTGFLFQKTRLGSDKLFERKAKAPSVEQSPVASDEDDEEVIAAIFAAIAAVYAEESNDDKPDFVIRRVKRKK